MDGPWPSATDFSIVVASLHQFSSDIIVPALYAADPMSTVSNDAPIILGTLLMLREALILNADSIFGNLDHDTDDDEESHDVAAQPQDSQSEYFMASTLATSVLLAALDSLGGTSASTFAPKFLRLVDAYESGQGDFAQLMVEEGTDAVSSSVRWPNGTPMTEKEREDWQSSYRYVKPCLFSMLTR